MTKRDEKPTEQATPSVPGKKPVGVSHTLDFDSSPAERTPSPTANASAPSAEDMMVHFQQTGDISVEDFDAMIRKQLEQTGGLLAFGDGDASLTVETPSSPADQPPPTTATPASPPVQKTVTTPAPKPGPDESGESFAETSALSIKELEKMAIPYAQTSALPTTDSQDSALPFMQTSALTSVELEKESLAFARTSAVKSVPVSAVTADATDMEAPSPWEFEAPESLPTDLHVLVPQAEVPDASERTMLDKTSPEISGKTIPEQDPPVRELPDAHPPIPITDHNPAGPLPSGDAMSISQLQAHADPMIGQVVVDRYRITDVLGKGGMGKVFRAVQLGLHRDVALKMLHPTLATEIESRTRFQLEAQSMTRISNPNVAGVYDFGEWHGQYFIAMEVLEGEPLSKFIPKEVGMETDEIVRIMEGICNGLNAAHTAGVVHRDLKPENVIILNDSGTVKLVDFGLAMLQDTPEEERLTVEGMTIGTPHYMSPEQCQGMGVDERSDIYSLGCILYEMLTGDLPFWGETLMAIMMQQLFAEAIPPTQRKGGVNAHPYLEALAMHALAKAPEDRPQNVEEFLKELHKLKTEESNPGRGSTIQLADRDARASAMGLPHLSGRIVRAPTKFAEVLFFVVESPEHYSESMTMSMWSNGFTVKQLDTLEEAIADIPHHLPGGIVVDITPNPAGLFEALIDAFGAGGLEDTAVVIVGPDDSFDMMTLALEMGAHDYVPVSNTKAKLPKSLRRLAKKHARKNKKK